MILLVYETNVTWNDNWVTFLDALMKVQMFADYGENVDKVLVTRLRRVNVNVAPFASLDKG